MFSIGIDQSYTSTGYCVMSKGEVLDYGVFKSDAALDIHDRAGYIADMLLLVVSKYINLGAVIITMEGLSFGLRGNATRDLAGLQFVIINKIRSCTTHRGIRLVAPSSLKKYATGSGGGKKGKVTKVDMFKALEPETQVLFKSTHKVSAGLYDIVDAYFLSKIGMDSMEVCSDIDSKL